MTVVEPSERSSNSLHRTSIQRVSAQQHNQLLDPLGEMIP